MTLGAAVLLHHTADEGRWVSFALNHYTQSSSSHSRRRNGLTTSWRQEQQEQQERQHEGQHTWQHVRQQDMQQEHKKGIHNGKTVPMQTVARSATGTATKHTNVKCITIASFIIFLLTLTFSCFAFSAVSRPSVCIIQCQSLSSANLLCFCVECHTSALTDEFDTLHAVHGGSC